MSLAQLGLTLAGAIAAAAAAAVLWRAEPAARHPAAAGYRWLATAAACWGAGTVTRLAFGGPVGGPIPLTAADLLSIAALVALVVGVVVLARPAAAAQGAPQGPPGQADESAREGRRPSGWRSASSWRPVASWRHTALRGPAAWRAAVGRRIATAPAGDPGRDRHPPAIRGAGAAPAADLSGALGAAADGFLLAAALFVIGWVTVFGSDWAASDGQASGFAVDLVPALTGLAALGVVLPLAARVRRSALVPALALLILTAGNVLAVGAAAQGANPSVATQLCWLAGVALLAAAPMRFARVGGRLTVRQVPDDELGTGRAPAPSLAAGGTAGGQSPGPGTAVACGAAVLAIVVLSLAALGGTVTAAAPLVAAAAAAGLLMAARLVWLVVSAAGGAASVRSSGQLFFSLAAKTSDVVLICDAAGVIEYASPAVADFGYEPSELTGARLASLVHPEDRITAVRAGAAGLHGAAAFSGRVRAADGSWRQVECGLGRFGDSGPDRLVVTARDLSDQLALRRQVTYLKFHDGLTGLPNRAYLEERAKNLLGPAADSNGAGSAAVRPRLPEHAGSGRPARGNGSRAGAQDGGPARVAAIFVDLDGFTAVNDSVGHGAGDLLLAQAGRRLRAAAPQATVARWGGDEFALLVTDATSDQEVVDLAERLCDRIAAEPFTVADIQIPLTASVGVALTGRGDAEHLLRNADVAMSRAKEAGGGRVEVFAAQMHAAVLRHLELATELQQALAEHQLAVEYQPIVELATSRVTAVEALVRWSRDGAPVPPGEFLGIAEESGLIVPLGEWVLREATRQLAAWRATGWGIGLAVNFSLRQVTAQGFAGSVLGSLAEAGLPSGALTVEVAERVLVDASGQIADDLASLRRSGVRLAIDDFGTGYASLAFLRQQAVDTIKIDPSFVAGLGADPTLTLLTQTIVRLGRELGIEVVAEGIERPEQLEQLRAIGCGLGQGYLVARPMTARSIDALNESAAAAGADRHASDEHAPAAEPGRQATRGPAAEAKSAGQPPVPGSRHDQAPVPPRPAQVPAAETPVAAG